MHDDILLHIAEQLGIDDQKFFEVVEDAEYVIYLYDGEKAYHIDDIIGFTNEKMKYGEMYSNPFDEYTHFRIELVNHKDKEVYARLTEN